MFGTQTTDLKHAKAVSCPTKLWRRLLSRWNFIIFKSNWRSGDWYNLLGVPQNKEFHTLEEIPLRLEEGGDQFIRSSPCALNTIHECMQSKTNRFVLVERGKSSSDEDVISESLLLKSLTSITSSKALPSVQLIEFTSACWSYLKLLVANRLCSLGISSKIDVRCPVWLDFPRIWWCCLYCLRPNLNVCADNALGYWTEWWQNRRGHLVLFKNGLFL